MICDEEFENEELLKKHKGETLRMALLSSHYRQPLNWNDKTIEQAQKVLNKLYRALKNAEEINIDYEKLNDKVPINLIESLCDDLNTSKALADINEIAKKLSKEKNNDKKLVLKESLLAAGKIFGILENNPDQWLGIHQSGSEVDEDKINYLIEKRNKARKERDFNLADEIRNELNEMGIEIEDTSEKTIWKIK